MGSTRRGFIGGAVAAGVVVPLQAHASDAEQCSPTPPGIRTNAIARTPSGRTIWSTDTSARTITATRTRDLARGRSIDVGGAPVAIAIAAHEPIAIVATAAYDHPGIAIVDLTTHEVTRLDAGPDPRAVAISADARRAYVVDDDGTIRRVDPLRERVHAPLELGAHPRDVALIAGGAIVSLNGEHAVALVRGTRVRKLATARFPHHLAVAGTRALVTHNGLGERRISVLDLEERRVKRRLTAGLEPAGVALRASKAVVTTSGGLAIVDLRTGRRRTRKLPGAPRAVCLSGTRAIVADAITGQLTKVRA